MGLLIGLKQDGKVYLGSDTLACVNGTKYYLTNPNNHRVFKVDDAPNMVMGAIGPIIENNILRTMYLVPEAVAIKGDVCFNFIVNGLVPHIFSKFEERNLINKKDDPWNIASDILVGYKDTLFFINGYGGTIQIDDYVALGNGAEEAIGSLMATKDVKDPIERITKALQVGLKNNIKVSYPLTIIDTEKTEIIYINE